MARQHYRLTVAIDSYWHPGSAHGKGAHLDAVTHRNSHGLPTLPGRTLKGLLRDAVRRADAFGWYGPGPDRTALLFGSADDKGDGASLPGLLRISDATLSDADSHHLKSNQQLIAGLYRSHFSTAIDHNSGSAKDKSLRGIELVVPLTLHATLTTIQDHAPTSEWVETLRTALPLIRAVGAHRARGLGRASLTIEEVKQ